MNQIENKYVEEDVILKEMLENEEIEVDEAIIMVDKKDDDDDDEEN